MSDLLTLAGLVAGLIAFLVGLFQYRRAQAWRRAEWVASEVQRFNEDPQVRVALTMIDWGSRWIDFKDVGMGERQESLLVTDTMTEALRAHEDGGEFEGVEPVIRDCFDRLLDRLERFEAFIQVGLISYQDVEPYLGYWLERIALLHSDAQGESRLLQLREYINRYGFEGVNTLLGRLRN